MKYYRSGKSYNNYKPRKSWRSFSTPKKKKVKQYDESSVGTLRYNNPFAHKRTRIGLNIKKFILPFLLFAWVGFLLYLPEFRVKNIKFSGLDIIKPEEIDLAVKNKFFNGFSIIPKNNYFLVNENSIYNFLNEKYSLNELSVTKEFPNTLYIDIKESASSAIFDNGKEYYLLSDSGTAIKFLKPVAASEYIYPEITTSSIIIATTTTSTIKYDHKPNYKKLSEEYGDLPIIYDMSEPTIAEKQAMMDSNTLKALIRFYNGLEKGKLGKVNYMTVKEPSSGITAYLDKPWKVIFQPADDINKQLDNLQVTIKNSHPNEYIDLRFGDRIYWK